MTDVEQLERRIEELETELEAARITMRNLKDEINEVLEVRLDSWLEIPADIMDKPMMVKAAND